MLHYVNKHPSSSFAQNDWKWDQLGQLCFTKIFHSLTATEKSDNTPRALLAPSPAPSESYMGPHVARLHLSFLVIPQNIHEDRVDFECQLCTDVHLLRWRRRGVGTARTIIGHHFSQEQQGARLTLWEKTHFKLNDRGQTQPLLRNEQWMHTHTHTQITKLILYSTQ